MQTTDLIESQPWIFRTAFVSTIDAVPSDGRNGTLRIYHHGWGGSVDDIRERFSDYYLHRPMIDRWARVPLNRSDPIDWIEHYLPEHWNDVDPNRVVWQKAQERSERRRLQKEREELAWLMGEDPSN